MAFIASRNSARILSVMVPFAAPTTAANPISKFYRRDATSAGLDCHLRCGLRGKPADSVTWISARRTKNARYFPKAIGPDQCCDTGKLLDRWSEVGFQANLQDGL